MIEVEKMVTLTDEAAFNTFLAKLKELGATDLGENNTENIFYLGNGYQMKVAKLLSKDKAKFALKPREMGADFSHELEVHFSLDEAETAEKMIDLLLAGTPKVPTVQQRHDYIVDDVEIAAKYSDDWGYHLELERMVNREDEIEAALEDIESVATKLGVRTMTKEEAGAHIRRELAKKGF